MKILFLDTTSERLLAAVENDGMKYSVSLESGLQHTGKALNTVDYILREANIAGAQLDCAIVSTGPGSFTGIRISHALLKGFFFDNEPKILPLTTLEAAFISSLNSIKTFADANALVIPLVFGRKQSYYAAAFSTSIDAFAQEIRENDYRDIPVTRLVSEMEAMTANANHDSRLRTIIVVENELHEETIRRLLPKYLIYRCPISAIAVLETVASNYSLFTTKLVTASLLAPEYVRKPDAETPH